MIYTQPDFINEGEGGCCAAGAGVATGVGAANTGSISTGDAVPMQDCPTMKQVAIDTEDVLGKCDHKHDGYMGKNCFHLPRKVMKTLHRKELCNGGSVRKKTKSGKNKKSAYEKGMKVITGYKDLVENQMIEDKSKLVYVFNIQHSMIDEICNQEGIDNKHFNKSQFMKLINDDVEFVGLFSRDKMKTCYSMAALRYNAANQDDCYVNEIQSFKSHGGFGKALLKRIIDTQERVWLMANTDSSDVLIKYYRDKVFNFDEYVVKNSIYEGREAHFFFTKDCNKQKLQKYIELKYSSKHRVDK